MFNDIQTLLIFWAMLFGFFVISSRGLGVVGDVLRPTGLFLLEKALGPAIDFAEGKPGSASRTWIIIGSLWLFLSVCFTFLGVWVGPVRTDLAVRLGIHPIFRHTDLRGDCGRIVWLHRNGGHWCIIPCPPFTLWHTWGTTKREEWYVGCDPMDRRSAPTVHRCPQPRSIRNRSDSSWDGRNGSRVRCGLGQHSVDTRQ